ncbi:YybH family protein [Kribbella sp. NPDC051586]|uniref:YybH family protein n=1 Tax=Kribbella sp. NPDC051586 TaxID=3364118 RepID=UPI0037B4CBBE
MKDGELDKVIEQDHEALAAFGLGDPGPKKRLYSRGDDVTLANPLGPPVRGWQGVSAALDAAAAMLRDGAVTGFERIAEGETTDPAYIVEIERSTTKLGGAEELSPVALRATTIYRREEDGWKIVHRHADPITTPRPVESVATP